MEFSKKCKEVAATMSTMEFLVLDGRSQGEGFCRACDRLDALGLTLPDGQKTDLGVEVLAYAKATQEI